MSANKPKPDLFKEMLADLEAIAGTRQGMERRIYQVGFLTTVLSRILMHDRILKREWDWRIKQIKERNKDQI